jgi:hypothetical protein
MYIKMLKLCVNLLSNLTIIQVLYTKTIYMYTNYSLKTVKPNKMSKSQIWRSCTRVEWRDAVYLQRSVYGNRRHVLFIVQSASMSLVMFWADVIAIICLMVCVKDEYLIKVSFLKYSGLLDYLLKCWRLSIKVYSITFHRKFVFKIS